MTTHTITGTAFQSGDAVAGLAGTWTIEPYSSNKVAFIGTADWMAGPRNYDTLADGTLSIDLEETDGTEFLWSATFKSADGDVKVGPLLFDLTADKTWQDIIETPTVPPVTPSLVSQAEAYRDQAQGFAQEAAAAASLAVWTPDTNYVTGDIVQGSDGSAISRLTDGTSRASFDATEQAAWVAVEAKDGTLSKAAVLDTSVGRTTRTKHASALGLFFPEAEGAVADGSADDTAAIVAAMAARDAAGWGRVECGGTYRVDGTVAVNAERALNAPKGALLTRTVDSTNTDPIVLLNGNRACLDGEGTIFTNNNSPRGVVRVGPSVPTKVAYGSTVNSGVATVTIPAGNADTFTADDIGKTISISPNSPDFTGKNIDVTTITAVDPGGLSCTVASAPTVSSTSTAVFWGVEETGVWSRIGGVQIQGAWINGSDGSTVSGDNTFTTTGAYWGPQHVGWSVRIQQAASVITGSDGVVSADATTGLLTVFTSAGSTFTGTQVGERITIAGAGVGGGSLSTVVVDVPNSTTLTLQVGATTAVSAAAWTLGATLHTKIASVNSPTSIELVDAPDITVTSAVWSAAPAVGLYMDSSPQGSSGGHFSTGIRGTVIRGFGTGLLACNQANAWGTHGVDYQHILDNAIHVIDCSSIGIQGGFIHQSPDVTCVNFENLIFAIVDELKAEPGGNSVPAKVTNCTRWDIHMTPNTFSAPVIDAASMQRGQYRSAGVPIYNRHRYVSTLGLDPTQAACAGTANRGVLTANDGIPVAIKLPFDMTITKIIWCAGAVSAGNYDLGLYDTNGAELWTQGSAPWPTAQTAKSVTVSPGVPAWAGQTFYLVLSADNNTAQFKANTNAPAFSQALQRVDGKLVAIKAVSSFPLPSSIAAAISAQVVPTGSGSAFTIPFIVLEGISSVYG